MTLSSSVQGSQVIQDEFNVPRIQHLVHPRNFSKTALTKQIVTIGWPHSRNSNRHPPKARFPSRNLPQRLPLHLALFLIIEAALPLVLPLWKSDPRVLVIGDTAFG